MTEEKQKPETEKLPMDFMANEFMNQQLTTLDKVNKQGGEKDAKGNLST